MDIKKGNKVKIICGKDKNKEGEIIEIDRKNFRAKVKGLNTDGIGFFETLKKNTFQIFLLFQQAKKK